MNAHAHLSLPIKFRALLGPSIQWRPMGNFFVNVVPFFGLTDKSPVIQSSIVLGFNFNMGETEGMEPPVTIRTR